MIILVVMIVGYVTVVVSIKKKRRMHSEPQGTGPEIYLVSTDVN